MSYHALSEPDHLPQKEKPTYLQAGLIISPLCSVALLLVALIQLGVGGGGWLGWIKLAFLGAGAFAVSYALFRMAIEKSAPQATLGYRSSLITGGVTTFLVGLAFFIATSAGLIVAACEALSLQAHNNAAVTYVDAREAQAAQAVQLVPTANAIFTDLTAKTEGEIATSSVSGSGSGGYGPTARALETLTGRAEGIAEQAQQGLETREALSGELRDLLNRMDATLSDEDRAIWERRNELRRLDSELGRTLSALDEAIPVALLAGYAQELRGGIAMQNPREADTINGFLGGYAGSIDAVLSDMNAQQIERPSFPQKVGALQTFDYAANFLPVIMIAFLVDMIFPLAL